MRKQLTSGESVAIRRTGFGRIRRVSRLVLAISPVATALFGFGRHASGQTTYIWDPTFSNSSGGSDGSGIWNTSTTDWFSGAADTAWVNGLTSFAVIGDNGTAGTITLGATITAGSVQFNSTGSGDYLITGGTLIAPSINVNYSGTPGTFNGPTIAAVLGGTSGETFSFAAGTNGTVNLAGVNNYTGTTVVNNATVVVQPGSNLGASANALSFGASGATTAGQLSLGASVTVSGITVATNVSNSDQLIIASGATLSSTTGVEIGGVNPGTAQYATTLSASGGGTWNATGSGTLGNFGVQTVGTDNNNATQADTVLNLSGLANFSYANTTGTFGIGWLVTRPNATAILSNTNSSITAAFMGIGDSVNPGASANNAGGGAVLELGAGANTLDVNSFQLGVSKGNGSIIFAGTVGSVVIAGTTGGTSTANMTLGDQSSGSGSANPSNLLLAGHLANVQLGTLAQSMDGGSTGASDSTLTFDTGTFTVGDLIMADHSSSNAGSSNSMLIIGGANANTTATGIFTVNTAFDLANDTGGTAVSSFTINGGTANIKTNIVNLGTNSYTTTLNLNAGTLNMNGNSIATSAAPITNANLLTNGGTATLMNLGGTGLNCGNGNGLTMNGGGLLLLAGTNNFTGTTFLNSGTLQLTAGTGLPNSIVNSNGGNLAFSSGIGSFTIGALGGNSNQISLADVGGSPVTLTIGAVSSTFGATLTGPGALVMAGVNGTAGTVQYFTSSGNNYTGNTTISGGTLQLENGGQLYNGVASPGTVTVSGGTLAGQGSVNTTVNLSSGVVTSDPGSPLTLNALNVTGGTLDFTLNGGSISDLDVTGAAHLTSGALQFLQPVGSTPQTGTYTILSALTLSNSLSLAEQTIRGTNYQPEIVGDDLEVIISGGPSNLVWEGTNSSGGTWDINTTADWNNQTTDVNPSVFHQLDNVTFDDSAKGFTVSVNGQVQPSTVTFNNNNNNYVLTSSTGGGISGTTGVNLQGSATVTINTVNTYTGDTDVNNGKLILGGSIDSTNANVQNNAAFTVGSGATLASANINVNGGTLTVASGASLTGTPSVADAGLISLGASETINSLNSSGSISGNGFNGNGTLVLAGTNSTLTVNTGGTFSGVIVDNGGHSALNVAGGALVLTGSNNYTGATSIASGATLQIDTGGNSGSLNPTTSIVDNGTLIYGRNDNPTVANNISGSGAFQQNGSGTLALSGNNSYSGGTEIYNGAVEVNPGSNLGATTGAVVLGLPQNPNGPQAASPSAALILNTSLAVGSFSSATTGNADFLNIGQGFTLTVNGGFTVGAANTSSSGTAFNGEFTANGGGALIVNAGANNFLIAQPSNDTGDAKDTTTADMSGLNSLTVNTTGTFGIGLGVNSRGFLTLANATVNSVAPVNYINAADIEVGDTAGGNDANVSALILGNGANTLYANTINIGLGKTDGTIAFNPSNSGGSVTISGTGGVGGAAITIGDASGGTEGTPRISALNLAGYNANVTATSLIIGENAGNSANEAIASVTFDTGTFTAQSVVIGADTSGTSAVGPQGTLAIGGANPNTTATGIFTVGSPSTPGTFLLGNNTNTGVTATAVANLTVNGGTMDVYANITVGSTAGSTTPNLTLAGGSVLNMEGNAITGPNINVSIAPNGSDSPTIENLGGTGINGAGVTMSGSGSLILAGVNTYLGGTTVTSGDLVTGSATALPAGNPLTVNGGTLDLNGNSPSVGSLAGSGGVITNNSSTSAGTLTINGAASTSFGGEFQDGSNGQALNIAYDGGGTLTLTGGSSSTSGTFSINSGMVNVTGSLASGGNVAVSGGTLGGTGSVGNVKMSTGAINPGSGTSGTLNVNSLTVSGGSLQYGISGGSVNSIQDSGNASFTGGSLVVTPYVSVNAGSYTLLNSSNLSGSPTLQPLFVRGETASFSTANNQIVLNVTGSGTPASLTWIGNANSGTWDTHTTANWNDTTFGIAHDVFDALDSVSFTDTASNFNVNISGSVDPSAMQENASNTYTFGGTGSIVGGASLAMNGSGTLIVDTNNSFSGGTTINSGTVQLGRATDSGTLSPLGAGAVVDNSALTVAAGSSTTINLPGAISGNGTLTVSSGTALLGGSNSFTGSVSVNAGGTLVGGSNGAFGAGATAPSVININGGTLTDLANAGYGVTLPNLTFTGGTLTSASGNTGSGNGNYLLNGNGTTATVTTNAASSTAVINARFVSIEQPTMFNVAPGTTPSGIDLLVTSDLINDAASPVVKTGAGVMAMDGNSTFSGGLTISAGTVQVGTSSDTGNLASPLGIGAVVNNSAITFDSSQTATVGNVISGSGTVTVNGGTAALTGNNTFTGGTTVASGVLHLNGTGGLSGAGSGVLTIDAGTTVVALDGDALGFDSTADPAQAPQSVVINGGTITSVTGAFRETLPNVTMTGGTITNIATNTGDANGNYSIEGLAQDTTGTLTVLPASSTALISATTLSFESTVTFNVSPGVSIGSANPDLLVTSQLISYGTFGLGMVKTGSGIMKITGSNTYTGGTNVTGGTLLVSNTVGSGTGTGPVSVGSGAELGGTGTISGAVSVASGGALTVAGGSPLTLSGSLSLANSSAIDYAAAGLTAPGLASTLLNGIAITGSSTVNVTVPTAFTGTEVFDVLTYNGNNPYSSLALGSLPSGYTGMLVNNPTQDQVDLSLSAGPASLTWNNAGGAGDGSHWDFTNQNWNNGASPSLYTDGSKVTFNDNNNGHYAVTLNTTVAPASVTFANTGTYTLSGTGGIAGTGAVTMSGTGTVTISTSNTYTGGTNVSAGDLVIGSVAAVPANSNVTITGGKLQLATVKGTYSLSGLSVSTGSLDVESNTVILSYGATDPIATIAGYLTDGFNSGWAAGEISSSAVNSADTTQSKILYAIGYADGADGPTLTTLPSGEIEILPTLAGDAKLQGNVVFGDYQILAQYFGKAGGWDEGNFKYGATINFGDFQVLAQDFGSTSSGLTAGELASMNSFAAQFGDALVANTGGGFSVVAVPEPTSIGFLAAAGLGLLARRRRRK